MGSGNASRSYSFPQHQLAWAAEMYPVDAAFAPYQLPPIAEMYPEGATFTPYQSPWAVGISQGGATLIPSYQSLSAAGMNPVGIAARTVHCFGDSEESYGFTDS
jgi:hypothetical protein